MAKQEAQETAIKPKGKYFYAVGRRKTAVATARVYLKGEGRIVVNGKELKDFLPYFEYQQQVRAPLKEAGLDAADVTLKVAGGGPRGQAEAIRHSIARAVLKYDEKLKPALRAAGFITRDARRKERKKPGLKKARRAPQWQKR